MTTELAQTLQSAFEIIQSSVGDNRITQEWLADIHGEAVEGRDNGENLKIEGVRCEVRVDATLTCSVL